MSLLDKIRKESEDPTITVPPRTDSLVRSLQLVEDKAVPSGDETLEQSLEAELSALPKISEKKVGVRLQQDILAELEDLCRRNDITMETLLESFYVVCAPQDKVMSKVVMEAQRRIKQRVRAGNIRSILTKSKNLKAVK